MAQRTEERSTRPWAAWIHPVLREDQGEIDLAEKGKLPPMVTPEMINGDFHVHTSLSGDGRSNLPDVIAAAKARGLKVVAITEHAENLSLNGVQRDDLLGQRAEILALRRRWATRCASCTASSSTSDRGRARLRRRLPQRVRFLLGFHHDRFDLDVAKQTKRVVRAMEDPSVKMIGHLQARMIAPARHRLDVDAVLQAAERPGTAIEINGACRASTPPSTCCSQRVWSQGRLVLTSDAHKADELDRVEYAALHAAKAWVPLEQIVNTMPADKLLAWAAR